jgi:acyl carrier protein
MPISWSEFLRINPVGRPFFDRVAAPSTKAPRQESHIRHQLKDAADPRALVTHHVRSVVGKVLGMHDPEELDPRARLFDVGLESLMAVELRGRFEESLGCSLRPTLLFDYPTIEALSDHLVGKVSEGAEKSPMESASDVDEHKVLADELEDLREDEIADRLARELSTITKA